MAEVTVHGRLICPDAASAARLRAALPAHIAASRAEPGCRAFDISPTEDPLVWQVAECFASADAFDAHRARTAASPWPAAASDVHSYLTIVGMR